MRRSRALHVFLLAALASLAASLAACDPPPEANGEAVNSGATGDDETAPVELPPAVAAMRDQLQAIAATGQPWDMARLADAVPGFVSNSGGMSHRDYWYLKLRTGDWPMAQMERVLAFPPAVEATPAGLVFVWPYMARLQPDTITGRAARDIEALAGEGAAAEMRAGARWPGYSLGVREDGVWLFFVSGSE